MGTMTLLFALSLSTALAASKPEITILQERVLSENPRLRSLEQEVQMMKKRIPQSRSLENPRIKIGVNNLPAGSLSFKSEDMTSKEIGISQMIPLGGKLGVKEKIALGEYNRSVERLRKERIELLHAARAAAYELAAVRGTLRILAQMKEQVKLLADSEVAAYRAGRGSLVNVIKANIEYSTIDEEAIVLRQREVELVEGIGYLAGHRMEIHLRDLPEPDFRPINIARVRQEIANANPDLRMARLDVEIGRGERSLSKREYYPDVELGVSYMQRDDRASKRRDDMISGMASFSIPFWFWSKNIPMVEEMEKKTSAAESRYNDIFNELDAKASILTGRLTKWRELASLYGEKLIPQAELSLETILARYRTSTLEFMPVIDTVRMILRYRKELLAAKREYQTSLSELRALMGEEIIP